jgi:hypothetical protein
MLSYTNLNVNEEGVFQTPRVFEKDDSLVLAFPSPSTRQNNHFRLSGVKAKASPDKLSPIKILGDNETPSLEDSSIMAK